MYLAILIPAVRFGDSIGRALFVAAIVVSIYALIRYRRALATRTRRVRVSLLILRGASLTFLALVLGNVQVDRSVVASARALVVQLSGAESDANAKNGTAGSMAVARAKLVDALNARRIAVTNAEDTDSQPAKNVTPIVAVLVSDGAVAADDAERAIVGARAASGGAPVFALATWANNESPLVALDRVAVSQGAIRGVPLLISCTLHGRGLVGRESLVTISDGSQVRASARLLWKEADQREMVAMQVVPKAAGWTSFVARVEAANGERPETLTREFAVFAEERRSRVLFFEGEPTWEAKFIRRALDESGLFDVDYFAQVSRAATAGVSEEQGTVPNEPDTGGESTSRNSDKGTSPEARLRALLNDVERLNAYDCIIVGATPNAMISKADAGRLQTWVERRGGGLIVLGGNSFSGSVVSSNGSLNAMLPANIDQKGFASQSQVQAKGMPVESERSRNLNDLTPTEAGAGGALRGYLDSREGNRSTNPVLTGQGLRLGEVRAGAVVLAVSGRPNESGTGDSGSALVAATRYGAGRVLLFAPSDSWRMRTNASEGQETSGAFDALWQGLVLWTSANARVPIELVLSNDSPGFGAIVSAEFHARNNAFNPIRIAKMNARVQNVKDESSAQQQPTLENGSSLEATTASNALSPDVYFTPSESDPNIWRAQFTAPARGKYLLMVEYEADGHQGQIEKRFAVFAPPAYEAGAAGDTLRRAARERGGDLYLVDDVDKLAENIASLSATTRRERSIVELRKWWPLALIIPLLLSGEWLLLKMSERRVDESES